MANLLDYQTPRRDGIRTSTFWIAFVPAYLLGIGVLNQLDDILHKVRTGYHNDGGVMFLSLYASPLFVIAAGAATSIWPRYKTIAFAVLFAIAAPMLVYLLWIALELL